MKVIDNKNLPTKPPIFPTLVTAIALDYWHAPQWLWGALGLFWVIVWIACISVISKQEKTDIFAEKQEKP